MGKMTDEGGGEVVAWCALTPNGQIAYFDGKPMVMPGPIGNEHHPTPLYTAPPSAPVGVITDEQIQSLWRAACDASPSSPAWSRHLRFARSVIDIAQQPAAVDEVKAYPLWQAIHAESAKAGHPCNVGLAQVIAALDAIATQPGGSDNDR